MGQGLHSAIHVAHMGMGAAEKTINVSGNNLANANTFGYKAERADFASFLSYNYHYGTGPGQTYTAGTNPLQIGMGVELASVTTDFTQGTFQEGMSNTDLSINGNGFLIVRDTLGAASNRPTYYTRNGVLKINENFDLTTNTGLYVMGYGINNKFEIQYDALTNLKIPVGEMHLAEQTTATSLSGLLNAIGDSATQGTVLRTQQMTDLSKTSPEGQKMTVSQVTYPNTEGKIQAAAGNDGGTVEEGQYIYRFAFVDAEGNESDYSAPTDPIDVGAGQNSISLTGLPNVSEGYSALRVYRAETNGDPTATPSFHLVDEIDPSATANSYVDRKSTAEISSGPELDRGRLQQGAYRYHVTYVDALGNESVPSAISDAFYLNSSDGGGQLLLSDIPIVEGDNPDGWTGRRIYRSTANDTSNFYLVAEVDSMDPEATVIDRFSDADLLDGTHREISEAGRGNTLITETTKLLDVGKYENGHFVAAFEKGSLVLTPQKGGEELKVATLEIDAGTTVADYLRFLNEAYGIRSTADGVPPDQGEIGKTLNGGAQGASVIDGALYLLGNAGIENTLTLDTNDMRLNKNPFDLGWRTTEQSSVGVGTSTDMEVYDSLGTPIDVRMTMVLESKSDTETIYRWYADSPDNQPTDGLAIAGGTGTIRFDSNGKLIDASNTTVTVERTGVASESPLSFDFEMNLDSLMALATDSPNLLQTEKDGAAAGTLYDFNILEDGTIMGVFTSGDQRVLGQIPLATFRNQEGLYKSGDSLYQASVNSGDAKIGIAGENGTGKIKGRSLELSNSDIGQEIVNMILASAMYRANAKVMTTSNEMYDALLRIV